MPYESWIEQSHKYKTSKYEDLKKELEKEGYSVIVKAVEMGARGFVVGTLYQFLGQIGIKGRNRAKCIRRFIEVTENSFMWICNKKKKTMEQFKEKVVKPTPDCEYVTRFTQYSHKERR